MTYYPTKGEDAVSPIGEKEFGLTKREYFAAMVLQGLLANSYFTKQASKALLKEKDEGTFDKELIERTLEITNELIEQLNK